MDVENTTWNNDMQSSSTTKGAPAGLGFGLGAKRVAKKKFVFELNLEIGRQFIGKFSNDNQVTAKGMIGVGFAF